jgi:sentrin-specific protease 1
MLHYRRTWVRSFNPFKIEISVKDLQNILTTNQDMILRCFDMVVRLLANKESRRPKEEIINNRKHYMDMRCWGLVLNFYESRTRQHRNG